MKTKDNLLFSLKERKGNWVSGELLSGELSVTRAAVCKHVRNLRQEGYDIESSTRKGYLLRGVTDRLLPHEIQDGLNTRTFGKGDILYFEETDSTNLKAKELAARGAPEGTVVIAEKQTCGRGRKQRVWFSPSGDGIYLSLVLRPPIPPNQAPRITLMTAVAVADALLSATGLPVRIKWPNDILVHGKKLAGILTEISTEMDAVDFVVVGLGLNVNTPIERFPQQIRGRATSILVESGKPCPRARIVRSYLEHFESRYEKLATEGFAPIMDRWRALTDVVGRRVSVKVINKEFVGQVTSVDNDGVLVVRDDEGESHRIFSGDLYFQE